MRRDFKELLIIWLSHYNVTILFLGCQSTDNVTTMMVFAVNSSLRLVRYLSNVHTWAIFFLRHLANTSSMVPFWASTDSGFVPNLGPASEEVVYSPNDSCSHFTQRLFPPKLPQQHTCTIYSIHSPSFKLIIPHIQASIYILLLLYMTKSLYHFFGSSWQADWSRSLVSDTIRDGTVCCNPLRFCMNSSMKLSLPSGISLNDCLLKWSPALADLYKVWLRL